MSSYINVFENMLFALRQFVESEKALNTDEIAYRLSVSSRTAQRMAKELNESGWLEFKRVGKSKLYFATEKAKQLFGVNA